ncbi:histidine kinase N-terminal 7TM domain-containing diguanylate cyclase [Paenibacillus tuaregi]|uniref:histidine kinase N-terminal 7TM domain-containing diguanylate cyclase n=1 Tax=Paenibacillus tuaregi TaxID=1816681 RepID=UPI000837E7F4|nr:histidine kinase N-terminal 7TM domain-containing protein [Paenibacillus tuaregi]
MNSQITTYITLVTTSGVLSVFLTLYTFTKRNEIPGSRTFIWSTIASAIYIFAFAFELASSSLAEIKGWTTVEYIGMPFVPVLNLLLIFRYIGRRVPRATAALMFVIPVITLIMVATNDLHHWFYKSIYLRADTPTPMADVVIGRWYIVHGAYTFGSLLAGTLLLMSQWNGTGKVYRKQLLILICGQLLPMTGAFLYLIGVTPDGMDPVPIIMCVTSGLYIWAMISARMLTIIPIAKERIFESMRDGVIVLDASDRLIEYNQVIGKMVPGIHPSMLGQSLDTVWQQLTGEPFPVSCRMDGAEEEMKWDTAGAAHYFQIRCSVIRRRDKEEAGKLLMLVDITPQKQLEEQLKRLAFYDGLTGIFNRTHFIYQCKGQLQSAQAEGTPLSLILFDIDHFKQINDTYGHDTGDEALRHVVNVCTQQLSADILFARYGGEEFVLSLPGAGTDQAGALAESIRSALEAAPFMAGGTCIRLSASFGVAQSARADQPLEALLRDADEALYTSKRAGRNAVSLFSLAQP